MYDMWLLSLQGLGKPGEGFRLGLWLVRALRTITIRKGHGWSSELLETLEMPSRAIRLATVILKGGGE